MCELKFGYATLRNVSTNTAVKIGQTANGDGCTKHGPPLAQSGGEAVVTWLMPSSMAY